MDKQTRPKTRAAGAALICAAALLLAVNIFFLFRALNMGEALGDINASGSGTVETLSAARKQLFWLNTLAISGFAALAAWLGAKYGRIKRELNTKNELLAKEKQRRGASEQRYRLLARDSDAIVFGVDLVNGTVEADDSFKKKLGYELTFMDFLSGQRLHPEDRARFAGYLDEIRRSRCTLTGEARVMAADGAYLSFELAECGIYGDGGELMGIAGRLFDVTRRRASEALLEKRAMMDEMTGVLNRGATEKLIGEHMRDRRSCGGSLLIIDIDDLKRINDSGGHMAGDDAIRRVASALRNHFRSTDVIGRIGGDEFMVFASEACAKERLMQIARGIRRQLSEDSSKEAVSCSIGVCVTEGRGVSFEEMYGRADAALYSVKRSGKGGCAFYSPSTADGR